MSALQGQMLRCALQCNFVIKIYPSYITHIALHQKDAEFIYLGRGPSITTWEKLKEAASALVCPFKRKKVDLTSAVLG